MELKYGKGSITFNAPGNLMGVLECKHDAAEPVDKVLKDSIVRPTGRPRLIKMLRKNKPGDVVIIVSDITRSIADYQQVLRFLVGEIVSAGVDEKNIEFVIAFGTHRHHTAEEDASLYGALINEFQFSSHDCHNDLVYLGRTSTGLEVKINRRVEEADFVVATGKVDFHYMAGFSGGRKSILPGISSYETIRSNHSKLVRDGVVIGETKKNIIAHEMEEAARLFNPDYLLNVVETPGHRTSRAFWGDSQLAFQEAVKFFKSARTVEINDKADCVIVSAGGYPGDRNFYHTHKSLNLAINAIRDKGSIILVGQCTEGFGNKKFMHLMLEHELDELLEYPEEKIEVGGHRAFLTAKILKNYKVYVLSDLNKKKLMQINFIPITSIDEGINIVKNEYGEKCRTYVIPDGKTVLPVLKDI